MTTVTHSRHFDSTFTRLVGLARRGALAVAVAVLGVGCGTSATERDTLPDTLAKAKKVLWIGAHPDDETSIVPLLVRLCVEGGAECSLISLTKGEGGTCALKSCEPDLGSYRFQEFEASSALLGAGALAFNFVNASALTPEESLENFAPTEEDKANLKNDLGGYIGDDYDVVITFDPRGGVNCDPDHRAVGSLVVDVAKELGVTSKVQLVVSRYRTSPQGATLPKATTIGFEVASDDPDVFVLHANATAEDGRTYYESFVDVLKEYKSQYTEKVVESFKKAPLEAQLVSLLALDDANLSDRDGAFCP